MFLQVEFLSEVDGGRFPLLVPTFYHQSVALPHGGALLHRLPVPVENLLGDEDKGFQGVGKATLEWERAIMVAPDVLSLYFKDTPRRSHGLALDLAGAKLLAAYGAGVSGYYAGVEMADGFV